MAAAHCLPCTVTARAGRAVGGATRLMRLMACVVRARRAHRARHAQRAPWGRLGQARVFLRGRQTRASQRCLSAPRGMAHRTFARAKCLASKAEA